MKFDYLPITSVATIISGGTPKTSMSEYWNGNIPWLSVKDFNNGSKFVYSTEKHITELGLKNSSTNLLRADDIIISARGTVGEMAMIPFDMAFNQSCFGIRANIEKILPDYLYYALKNNIQTIKSSTHGSVFDTITLKDFEVIKIPVPDLETQKKIVRILSALDQKIELNNKIGDNLLRVAHQIYINDIKSLPTVKTEKLGGLCRIKYGKGLPTSKILKSGYRVYGGNGAIGFYNEKMYDKPQVLISCRGAASGKVIFTRPECFVTNNSLVLECEDKYYYFIKEFSLDREYYDYTTGSAQPQITIDNIKEIKLSVPDDKTLTRFNATLRPLEEKYFAILEENEALAKTRDTLLPKLISGEINLDKVMTDE